MLVQGKKALIFGVANDKSIAYAIAKELKDNGASIALSYAGEALKKGSSPSTKNSAATSVPVRRVG